jgi:hypothetical protein
MDTLIALGTGVAYFYSLLGLLFPSFFTTEGLTPHVYFEVAATVTTLILLGRLFTIGLINLSNIFCPMNFKILSKSKLKNGKNKYLFC